MARSQWRHNSTMKLQFTAEESAAVLQRVNWKVYAEVLLDDEVIACTPHEFMDVNLHLLYTSSRLVLTSDPHSPYVQVIDVRVDEESAAGAGLSAKLEQDIVVVATFRGLIGGEDDSRTIMWRALLAPDDDREEGGAQEDGHGGGGGGGGVDALSMETDGYCVVKSLFTCPSTLSKPRRWDGIQLRANALGVQRALDEVVA